MSYTRISSDAECISAANNAMMGSTAYAVSQNVSLLPFSPESLNLKLSYMEYGSPKADKFSMGAGLKLSERLSIGLTAASIAHSEYDIISESGSASGTFNPSDLKLGLGAGLQLSPNLSTGLTVYYLSESLTNNSKNNIICSDILLTGIINDMKISGGIRSIGTKMKAADGRTFAAPASIYLGVLFDREFGDCGRIKAAADADYYFNGGLGASLGAGYNWKDMISARAGFRYGGDTVVPGCISAGLGVKFSGICIDASISAGTGKVKAGTVCLSIGYCL